MMCFFVDLVLGNSCGLLGDLCVRGVALRIWVLWVVDFGGVGWFLDLVWVGRFGVVGLGWFGCCFGLVVCRLVLVLLLRACCVIILAG